METLITKKHLLVIGGTGYIGFHLIREALVRGMKVTCFSKSMPMGSRFLSEVNYCQLDISDVDQLRSDENKFDYVVNLSGYVNHSNYFHGGKEIIDTHFGGLINLINWLNLSSIEKFVNIGSSEEYGQNQAPQSEDLREKPESPYAFAKTAATHFLQMLHRSQGFPCTSIRPFLIYGPNQNPERLIPQVIMGFMEKADVKVSDGKQIRDFCYIDDFVDAIFFILKEPKCNGEVLNIGSGSPISIKEVIEKIRGLMSHGTPIYGATPRRKSENANLFPSLKNTQSLISWIPKVSLEEGLLKTIESMKSINVK